MLATNANHVLANIDGGEYAPKASGDHRQCVMDGRAEQLSERLRWLYWWRRCGLAERGLSALWENTHFYCDDSESRAILYPTGNGYQVRQIPLMIKPVGETLDDEYQEAVINYDASGNITSFSLYTKHYCLSECDEER